MKSIQESIIGRKGSNSRGLDIFRDHDIVVIEDGARKILFRVLTDTEKDKITKDLNIPEEEFGSEPFIFYSYKTGNFLFAPTQFDPRTGEISVKHGVPINVVEIYSCLSTHKYGGTSDIKSYCHEDYMWDSIYNKNYKLKWYKLKWKKK